MRLKVVICGSYHRDIIGLKSLFKELEITSCRILSPLSIDFVNESESVVKTKSENDFSTHELEKFHLRAIDEADFVWVHVPDGYVGLSTSFEIGYCKAINKPIFSKCLPTDEMLSTQLIRVSSVFEAIETISF